MSNFAVNLNTENPYIDKIRQNYQHQNAPFNGENLRVNGNQQIQGVNGVETAGFSGGYDYSVPKVNNPSIAGGTTSFCGPEHRNPDGSPAVVGGKFILDPMNYYG